MLSVAFFFHKRGGYFIIVAPYEIIALKACIARVNTLVFSALKEEEKA